VTFRTRLLLIFTVTIVAAVGIVEWLVTDRTREAFERLEGQRVDALIAQFQTEFARRGKEIVRAVNTVAATDTAVQIAGAADYTSFYDAATELAAAHGLGLLELVADDGTIVSSAEWPARFGYKEAWLTERSDWKARWARPPPATANCTSWAASSSTTTSCLPWCCRRACACCSIAISIRNSLPRR
jgi:hypothetical protein